MNVVYITGAFLFNNTSVNMSHVAYVKGLFDNEEDLEIMMASDSLGERKSKFRLW